MSKLTINIIFKVITLILTLIRKIIRLTYSILDVIDDGVLNDSYTKPEWYQNLAEFIIQLEDAASMISGVGTKVLNNGDSNTD